MLKKALAGLLFIGVALASPAQAADSGFYVFGNLGMAKLKTDPEMDPGMTVDDKDTAWKLGGGYMFMRYVGIEAGYAQLGELTASDPSPFNVNISASGPFVAAIGVLPLGERFSLFGRLGVINAKVEVDG